MSMIKNIKEFIGKSKSDISLLIMGLLILSLPFERIPSFDVFGITIRASLIMGALVIMRAAYLLIKKEISFKKSLPAVLLAVFVLWIVLLIPESINFKRAIQVVIYDIFVIMLAVSVSLLYKKEYLKYLISLLFAVTLLISAFAFYQFIGDIIGIPYAYTGLAERYTSGLFGFPRVQAASLEPLYFGSYMLIPTMISMVLLITNNSDITKRKNLYILLFIFTTIIFITVARGAIYGLVLGVLSVCFIAAVKKLSNFKIIGLALATILLGFIASLIIINYGSRIPLDVSKTFGKKGASAFTQQLTRTTLNDSDERAIARSQAIDLLKNNKSSFVVGLGPGQFGPYIQNNKISQDGWAIVNNLTLELLVETGAIGLGLILAFFIVIVAGGYQSINTKSDLSSAVIIGSIGYLASQAVQYQGFSTLYVVHIWVVAGLMIGIVFNKRY